jgi:polyisoprenoid-binding protein YceI
MTPAPAAAPEPARVSPSLRARLAGQARRALSLIAALAALALHPAAAAPVAYLLQPEKSVVGFETDFGTGGIKITGRMPITAADLVIDFQKVANSRVDVTVDAAGARTSNPLATDAMRGAKVLAVQQFPTLRFVSTKVSPKGDGAEIAGNLTIRDVTRPVVLAAQIYRQKGTVEGDLSQLSILLTGAVNRSDYGANGFPDMVGDEVRLKILARIQRK